jgi:hypothetical protein
LKRANIRKMNEDVLNEREASRSRRRMGYDE